MPPRSTLPPVLVIDDSADDLILIKRLLVKAGVAHPIVTFDDTAKVIAFLKAACSTADSGLVPWLIFTDIKMPRMNGFELVKWIREQKQLARVPVVMLSSSSEDRDVKRARTLGANRYLVKLPKPEIIAKIISDRA